MSKEEQRVSDKSKFDEYNQLDWKEEFSDSGVLDTESDLKNEAYAQKWLLDGEVAAVRNTHEGMTLKAGPRLFNDDHHMVLWAKQEFSGDLRIEYEYTRTDFLNMCVNILYIQATGMEKGPYKKDIFEWNDLRKSPAMAMYHDYMNTYHVSFAAFQDEKNPEDDYIRARRYIPKGDDVKEGLGAGLDSTDLEPDYFNTGLFKSGVPHKFVVIKKDQNIAMRIECEGEEHYYHWSNTQAPAITEGKVGFRLMFGRSMLLKNIKIMSR